MQRNTFQKRLFTTTLAFVVLLTPGYAQPTYQITGYLPSNLVPLKLRQDGTILARYNTQLVSWNGQQTSVLATIPQGMSIDSVNENGHVLLRGRDANGLPTYFVWNLSDPPVSAPAPFFGTIYGFNNHDTVLFRDSLGLALWSATEGIRRPELGNNHTFAPIGRVFLNNSNEVFGGCAGWFGTIPQPPPRQCGSGLPLCDDGIYCNGAEYCDVSSATCKRYRPPCVSELCVEESRQCQGGVFQWSAGAPTVHVPPTGPLTYGYITAINDLGHAIVRGKTANSLDTYLFASGTWEHLEDCGDCRFLSNNDLAAGEEGSFPNHVVLSTTQWTHDLNNLISPRVDCLNNAPGARNLSLMNARGDLLVEGHWEYLDTGLCNQRQFALLRSSETDFNLKIDHVEYSQAIQDFANSIPLIYDRDILVRAWVHVDSPSNSPSDVIDGWDAVLHVYIDIGGLSVRACTIRSMNGPHARISEPNYSTTNLDDTLNFIIRIPSGLEVDSFVVEVNPSPFKPAPACFLDTNLFPAPSTPYSPLLENDRSDNRSDPYHPDFQCRRDPNVSYSTVQVATTQPVDQGRKATGATLYKKIFPIPHVNYCEEPRCNQRLADYSCNPEWLDAIVIEGDMCMSEFHPYPDSLIKWIPVYSRFTGNLIEACFEAGRTLRYFDTSVVAEYPSTFERTVAHELGHQLGFDEELAPYVTQQVGVDLHSIIPYAWLLPVGLADFMRQGVPSIATWITTERLRDLFTVTDDTFDCPIPYTQAPTRWSCTDHTISVWGRVSPDLALQVDRLAEFSYLAPQVVASGGTLLVKSFDVLGGELDTVSFHSPKDKELSGSQWTPFRVNLPKYAGPDCVPMHRIDFVDTISGKTLFSRSRTHHAPEIAFVHPSEGSTILHGQPISWTGADADSDSLVYTLRFSWNGGTSFVPLAYNTTAASILFEDIDRGSQPGKGVLELSASDGFNTTRVELRNLTIGTRKPPTASIINPSDGSSKLVLGGVSFEANVYDFEDGLLPDGGILWTSSLDGIIGSGRSFLTYGLSEGDHVITVTATDSDSMSASDSVSIAIGPRPHNCPGDLGCDSLIGPEEMKRFNECMRGPTGDVATTDPQCLGLFDYNSDGKVDLNDFAELQRRYNQLQ